MRIVLACSAGGHLRQLDVLKPWWSQHQRHWITFDKPDALSVLAGERVTWARHPTARNIPNLLRNFRVTWRVLRQFHPDVIVTTGSAIAVPLFVLSRILGIRTVYIEVFDRIDNATLSAKLCKPMTDLFLVQWDEQVKLYSGSTVVGQLL